MVERDVIIKDEQLNLVELLESVEVITGKH
jgi:hypothetical protein